MRDPGNWQETVFKLEGLGFRLGLRSGWGTQVAKDCCLVVCTFVKGYAFD